MARTIAVVPPPPVVVCVGAWSRRLAPQRQRESGKEIAGTASDILARRIAVESAYLALAERAVVALCLGHRWCYTLRR